jgi:hypothetical protein
MADDSHHIDSPRSVCLCDVGAPGYVAAVAIEADGSQHFVLAENESIGDATVRYDASCSAVEHEQLGRLPIAFVHRITVSRRTHRCGRRTKSGTPCRTSVTRPGDACGWHRTEARQ